MKPAIRLDQQGKIVTAIPAGGSGDLENSLCVFEEGIHARNLSAETPRF
jgi:hypothetical protein